MLSSSAKKWVAYALVPALFGVAAFLWTIPMRREAQLRNASLDELKRIAGGKTPDDTRLLFYLGRRYIQAGREEGMKFLSMAANRAPSDAEIWRESANAARIYQDADTARKLVNIFVANNPENAAGRAARAEQLLRDGRNDDAEKEANAALKRDAVNADALRILALCQSARNQTADAEATLRRAIAADAKNAPAKAALADLLTDKRNYTAAIPLYRDALTLDPDAPAANTGLALALLSADPSGKPAGEALKLALRGLKGDDGSYLAHFALGRAFQCSGDFPQAMQELDTARLMSPTFTEAYFQLAATAKRAGLMEEAARWLKLHREKQRFLAEKDVRQSKNREGASDPEKLRVMATDFAGWLAQNGDYGAALSLYQDLMAEENSPVALTLEGNALLRSPGCRDYLLLNKPTPQLIKKARHALSRDRREALTYFTAAFRRNRANVAAFEGAGYAAYLSGDLDLAVKLFKDAVRADPNRAASSFLLLAKIAASLRMDEETDWYAQQTLRLDPQNAEAWYLTGEAGRDDPQKAEERFANAVKFDRPKEPGYYERKYLAALGEMQTANNKIVEAEATFQRGLQNAPYADDILLPYAALLIEHTDRYDAAIALLEKARETAKDDPAFSYRLGVAYGKKGDYPKAIAALEAARRGPLARDAAYALAQIYQKKGDAAKSAQFRAEAVRRQSEYLTALHASEQKTGMAPVLHLRLARQKASTPDRVQALSDYEAYLTARPADAAIRSERDALLRALTAEGVPLPRNNIETVRELRNYKNLPPITANAKSDSARGVGAFVLRVQPVRLRRKNVTQRRKDAKKSANHPSAFFFASLRLCVTFFLLSLTGCTRKTNAPTPRAESDFALVTEASGITYRYAKWWKEPGNIQQTVGNGCAFLDYDNDGNLDILLVGKPCALYKGNGNGKFTDVSEETGIAALLGRFLGVAVGDYDNDSFSDIYLSAYRGGALLHNESGKRFVQRTGALGIPAQPFGTSCAFADMNGDGFVDLFVGNYVVFGPDTDPQLCKEKEQMTSCGPRFYKPEFGALFVNQGGGKFTRDGEILRGIATSGKVLGVASVRTPGASRPTLILTNDEMAGDLLAPTNTGGYRNDGEISGVAYGKRGDLYGGMGADWGDFDNDGRFDLFVATFTAEEKGLYRDTGDGVYEEIGAARGLTPLNSLVSFGVKFADFDNDGFLDLVVASGHIQDNIEKIDPNQRYKQPLTLLRNDGGKTFADRSARLPADARLPIAGRGIAVGDYDNDGKMDFLAVDSEGVPLLLRNETPNAGSQLTLMLEGTGKSNRDAYGAIVTVTAGGRKFIRACRADGSYLSSSDKRVHIGLGDAATADIAIEWPDGVKTAYRNVAANARYLVRQGDAPQTLL